MAAARKTRLDTCLAADGSCRCFDGRTALSRHHVLPEQQRELQHEESVSKMLWKVVVCCCFGHGGQLSMLVNSQLKRVTIRINSSCSYLELSSPSLVLQEIKPMTTGHRLLLHSAVIKLLLFCAPPKRRRARNALVEMPMCMSGCLSSWSFT
jgi:hypothetical protein